MKPGRAARLGPGAAVLWLVAVAASSCTYDPNHICGANEVVYGDGVRCICVAGAALTSQGCVLCGDHQVAGDGGCVCADGFAQSTPGGACTPADMDPDGSLDGACDAASDGDCAQ